MNMPGFTADQSVYKTSKSYHLTRTASAAMSSEGMQQAEGSVIPQRIKLQEWTCDCDAATDICICKSEHGAMRAIHAVLGEL